MNQNQLLIVFLVIAVIAVAAVAFAVMRKRRSQKLRERFGPEYDRVVRREGDVGKGEGVLEFREKRREKFKIRPLSPTDKSSFGHRWNEVPRLSNGRLRSARCRHFRGLSSGR